MLVLVLGVMLEVLTTDQDVPFGLSVPVGLAMTVPFVWGRTHPLPVVVVVLVAWVVQGLAGDWQQEPQSELLPAALAFWCVGLLFGYVSGNDPGPNADQAFRTLISVIPFLLLTISYLVSLLLKASDNPTRHTE